MFATRYDSNWETLATGEVRHLRRLIRLGWTPVAVIMIDGPPVGPASGVYEPSRHEPDLLAWFLIYYKYIFTIIIYIYL